MKHKLIFISTPYTHKNHQIEDIRYSQAIEYTAILMNQGKFAYSPIAGGVKIAKSHKLPTDWGYWGNFCEAMMERCDEVHILMLKGWEDSTGVKSEIELATSLGKKIVYVDPNDVLIKTINLMTNDEKLKAVSNFIESDKGKEYLEKFKIKKDEEVVEAEIPTFRELLLSLMPSKEIKQRFANKQIKINNIPIKNLDIDLEFKTNWSVDLGTFLAMDVIDIDKLIPCKRIGIDFKDFFGEHDFEGTTGNSPVYLRPLRKYTLLSISKTEHFVFKRKIKNYNYE